MADKIELVSFDVDTATATKQVDSYIATLNKLELELRELQKQGKDTTAVQNKIAQATAQLNKALTAETTTLKGAVSQTAAYNKAQKELDSTTKKTIATTNNLSAATQKQAAGFARSLAGAKNLTQTFTRGAGALANFTGGFGLSAQAVGVLSNVASKAVDGLYALFVQSEAVAEVQASVEEATKGVISEYVSEARTLNSLLTPLGDANTSTADRQKLIAEIQERYPEYLANINLETVNSTNLAAVQKVINDRLIEGIVLRAKAAEQEKILNKIVELTLESQKIQTRVSDENAEAFGGVIGSLFGFQAAGGVAAKALNDVDASFRKVQLDNQIAELAAEQNNLDETFSGLSESLKGLGLDLGANNEAQKTLTKSTEKTAKATSKQKDDNEAAAGSLAMLRAELDKVNKLLTDQTNVTDTKRLAELGAEYQRITKEIESAQAAIDAVTKARKADEVQIIKNAKIGNVQNALLEVEISQNQKLAETLEVQRQRELNLIESNRQKNLAATQNETARNVINAAAAKERERVEAESAANILKIRLKTQQQKLQLAEREKQDTTEISKEILSLEADLLKLTAKQYDIKVGFDDKSGDTAKERLKKLVNQVADVVQEFSGQVFDFLSSQNQAAIAQADAAISKQQELLNGLLANEQQVNVEQVRLEQERLDKLNKAREKAAENEARIAQAQIAINLALAVARAVAEGGGLASAITVGLALSAAVFGFLKAKQAASQAFYEGTMYAERAPHEPAGRDTINARLNEGEAVIPTDTTKKYNKSLEAIYYGKIPAADMNKMVGDYLSGAKAVRSLADNAAQGNKQQFQIVALASAERKTAKAANYSGSPKDYDIRLFAELVTAEIRKLPKSQVKAGDLAKVIQSRADNKGKIRKRLGLK